MPYAAYGSTPASANDSPLLVRAASPRTRRKAEQRAAEMEMEDEAMFQL